MEIENKKITREFFHIFHRNNADKIQSVTNLSLMRDIVSENNERVVVFIKHVKGNPEENINLIRNLKMFENIVYQITVIEIKF